MLCRNDTGETGMKRSETELKKLKNQLKQLFKDGAIRNGGREEDIINARFLLRFLYAEEIEKVRTEVELDCIGSAPLPQYGPNVKTVSERMKQLFTDAKIAQENIDPYLVADYVDFMKFVQSIDEKFNKSVQNMSPEEILASQKHLVYLLYELKFQGNKFYPKNFYL